MDSNQDVELGMKRQSKRICLHKGDENEGLEQVDRISNLPDHLIDYILSFLDTQEAVKTSILSSRWRHLWKGITRISLWSSGFKLDTFVKFVEHVLFNCTSKSLEKFELYCPDSIDFSRLSGWIFCAQVYNIKKLILRVDMPFMELPERPLPLCILSCTTLVVLELESCFDIMIHPSVSCFPCLKSLSLYFISPDHDDAMHQLFSCCPVLEKLDLSGYLDSPEMLTLDISIPTLKSLTLWIKDEGYATIRDHNIIIDTPNLEYLSITDDSLSCYVLNNLYRLRDVHLNYEAICLGNLFPEHIIRLFGLFKGIYATELLTLYSHTLDILRSAINYTSIDNTWLLFPFLVCLILQPSSFSAWSCLNVLHATPNIEFLILDLEEINDVDDRANCHLWTPPESVPRCLLQCLKKIGIKHFEGNKDELQAVEYLLNNAQVLDFLMIGFDPYPMNEKVVEKLLAFPRASKSCDVRLYEYLWFETKMTTSQNIITFNW